MTAGKAAALFCETMSGAYVKLAQKAEADRTLPADFRLDLAHNMRRLKFGADRPTRIEVWNLIDREPEMLEGGAVVGAVEGSASTAIAVNLHFPTHTEIAAIMRASAASRLRFGFGKIAQTAESYGEESQLGRNLGRLARAGEARAEIECNCALAPIQYEIGYRLFHGVKVTIGKRTIPFDAARVTKSGSTYYRMTKMPGSVLAEVYEDSARQSDAPLFAMASVAVFILHTAHGVFESDRHAGQANEENMGLNHYDMKALLVDSATGLYRVWEKRDFEHVATIVAAVLDGGKDLSVQNLLSAEEQLAREGIAVSPLVTELQTGQLALGDSLSKLTGEQIREAVMAGLVRGMHPHLAEAIVEKVAPRIPTILLPLVQKSLKNCLISGDFSGMIGGMLKSYGIGVEGRHRIAIELPPQWKELVYQAAYNSTDPLNPIPRKTV